MTQVSRLDRTDGHWSYIDGVPYAYFYRELDGYAPESLLVGVAIPASESFWFRWAALMAAALGAILLLISVFIAFALARRIAAPVIQIEDALGKLQNMEFDRVSLPKLNSSNIAEWRSSASNLTSTASALSMFNQYVPSKLAKRLMSSPSETARAQERAVTVMFIDMEGFSEFARTHTANQSAERLNDVFKIIGPIIEASGGVIDKYTGDGLMAFWGAPDDQPDHTQRAITAAYDIRQAIIGVSSEVWFQGTPRLRLGMHCGSAIVGNLGFKGRINYTLVGNTVNSAERMEQALRGQDIERHVVIGLSGEMFEQSKPFKGSDQTTKLVVKGREIAILND